MPNDKHPQSPAEPVGRGRKSLGEPASPTTSPTTSSTPSGGAVPSPAAAKQLPVSRGDVTAGPAAGADTASKAGSNAGQAAGLAGNGGAGVAAGVAGARVQQGLSGDGSNGARAAAGRYAGAATSGAVSGAQAGGLHGAAAGVVQGVAVEGAKDVAKDLKGGFEGSKVGRAAVVGGAAAGAPQALGVVAIMAIISWLKSMFFAMAAMMVNLSTLIWQAVVAVVKSIGHAIAAPFVAVGGFVGNIAGATFGIGTAVATPVATAGVSIVTMLSLLGGLLGYLDGKDRRDEALDRDVDCASQTVQVGGPVAPNVEAHAQAVYTVMKGWGMPEENIAGILGNWSAESGIDPTSVEGIFTEPYTIGPRKQAAWDADFAHMGYVQHAGIGLGQWTNGRNRLLISYAASKGVDWYALRTQLAFMVQGDSPGDVAVVKDMIENSKGTPRDAAFFFHDEWERSADTPAMAERRATAAETWFARMSSWDGGGGVTVPIGAQPATGTGPMGPVDLTGVADAVGEVIPADAAPVSLATANIPMRSGWGGFTSSMKTVLRGSPDLVGLQEVSGYSIARIQSAAPGYTAFTDVSPGNPPGDDRLNGNAVLWKADTYDVLGKGRITIVEDDTTTYQGKPGTWDRGATWVQLKRKADGVVISFFSVHHMTNPDKYGPDKPARRQLYGKGMDTLLHKIAQLSSAGPVFVAGDMNTHADTPGTWTAASKMQSAGFQWAHRAVDFIFGPSLTTLQSQSTGRMVSDRQWVKATYEIAGMAIANFFDGLSNVVGLLTGGGECESAFAASFDGLSDGLSDGGLDDAKARALMDLYNQEGDAFLDAKYGDRGGPGSCGSNHAMNCVSFSTYFMNKYTSFQQYAPGNGVSTADTIAAMTGRKTTRTPTAYSVFSHANTNYGHTGVVLGVRGGDILIGEAGYCAFMGRTRWVPASEWQGGNWEFIDVTDLVVGSGLTSA